MEDLVFGAAAVLVGALLCFRGYLALRVVIPLWGALAGFSLGAGAVAALAGEGFLSSVLGWGAGLVVAVVFAAVAYLYYAVSVVVAMAAIGFVLGNAVMLAIRPTWSWVAVVVGAVVGAALAALALRVDLPMMLLVVLTALAGATVTTTGILLLIGAVDIADVGATDARGWGDGRWWWYALDGALAVAGVVVQVRSAEQLHTSMRAAWEAERGIVAAGTRPV